MKKQIFTTLSLFLLSLSVMAEESPSSLTINKIGECLADKLGETMRIHSSGRGNIFVSSKRTLNLELFYNEFDENIPMLYHISVKGGYGSNQVNVESVDFYYQMEEMSDEELKILTDDAENDKEFMQFFFPKGLTKDWDSDKGKEQLTTLTLFNSEKFDRFNRNLVKLKGIRSYNMQGQSDSEVEKQQKQFWNYAENNPIKKEEVEIIISRKDGTGEKFNVTSCFFEAN